MTSRNEESTNAAPRKSALGRHLRSSRLAIAGIVAAALTAALTQVMTGWISNGWRYLFGQPEPAPIAIVVQPLQDNVCDQHWMTPSPPQGLPPPPRSTDASTVREDWSRWAEQVKGVPVGTQVLLRVQGRTDTQVTITGIEFNVLKRAPAFAGTNAYANCGAGPGPIRWLYVNLDKEPPQVSAKFDERNPELIVGNAPAWERKPIRFPYNLQVSKSETETFLISAGTDDCDCTWTGQLDWVSLDRKGSLPIDNNGAPFRTTSSKLADHTCQSLMGTGPWNCG